MQITNPITFTSKEAAIKFSTTDQTLAYLRHKHSDELVPGIHYFKSYDHASGKRQEIIKWTLRGVEFLGFFIRGKEAKFFRVWASRELDEEFLRQTQELKALRKQNLALTNQIIDLKDQIDKNSEFNGKSAKWWWTQCVELKASNSALKKANKLLKKDEKVLPILVKILQNLERARDHTGTLYRFLLNSDASSSSYFKDE